MPGAGDASWRTEAHPLRRPLDHGGLLADENGRDRTDDGTEPDVDATLDAKGHLVIVEIKVSKTDLLGDAKWQDYLDHCDRYFWAVPLGFPQTPFDEPWFQPGRAGLLVADRWEAAALRDAAWVPMNAARPAVQERFGRAACFGAVLIVRGRLRRAGKRDISVTAESVVPLA